MAISRAEKAYEKYAWILVFLSAAFLILGGFVTLRQGPTGLVGDGPLTWEEVFARFPGAESFVINNLYKSLGISFLGFAFLTMAISRFSFRKGERWAWFALWSVPIVYVGFFAVSGPTAFPLLLIAIIAILGLLLPYRKFFPKK